MTQQELTDAIYNAHAKTIRNIAKCVIVAAFTFIALAFFTGKFDRDSTDGQERSGMRLHTDKLTGCQYLSVINGGITPRLSTDGKHQGCRGNR
ncbi:hypothetical protein [Microbulbifer sp. JSM ZJ756]|uniref:hypothetical protein n=1 Tax=Microbulbifer sp. JSM ZJ756 TaxID=3376191 RepID=UPI0037ABEBF1